MLNFRRIKFFRRKSWFGKLIRIPFKLIPSNAIVPILRGPLKKKKWIKGSHNISVLLGIYESKQSKTFLKFARNSNTFWDIGSHAGYYSLLFNSVSPAGKIFAFEPLQDSVNIYQQHMILNNITNFNVFPYAVSNKSGLYNFRKTKTSVAGKLDDLGETTVKVIKLSEFLSERHITAPDIIKMDIEGAEFTVLSDLQLILKEKMPTIFVSTHGIKIHHDCINLLENIGYVLNPLDTNDIESCKEFIGYDKTSLFKF